MIKKNKLFKLVLRLMQTIQNDLSHE